MSSTSTHGCLSGSLVNQRLRQTKPSASLEAAQKARDLAAQGRRILSLATGEPDFPTPDHVKEAAYRAIAENKTTYPPVNGLPALRAAIAAKLRRENSVDYDPADIVVCNGVKQVIFNAMACSLEPGDEVVIPAPYWVSYTEIVRLNGGVPRILETSWETGFKPTPEALEAAITPRTRWLMLNNPNNPTGAVLDEGDLRALAAVLERHPHVHVLSDDIYEHIRYDQRPYFTLAQVGGDLRKRILTVNGLSKSYNMTGWRVGYAAGPRDLVAAMRTLQGQTTGGVMQPAQWAGIAALEGSRAFMDANVATFRERRDKAVAWINAIPGLECRAPEGAFYLFVRCAGLIDRVTPSGQVIASDADLAAYLVDEAGVVTVPGAAFGASPYFRLSYACSTEHLQDACEAMAIALGKLTAKETA